MKTKLLLFTVALVAAGCGGPKGRGPEAPPTNVGRASTFTIPAADEKILTEALAKKRAGDLAGAFRLAESLPVDSPARLDDRYDEITSAWSDQRSKEIGRQIAESSSKLGTVGAGPSKFGDGPKTALDAGTFDKVVEKERVGLRNECFKTGTAATDFAMSVHVDSSGAVRDVLIDDLKGDRAVADCVRSQAYNWKFPPSTIGGDFTTTMYFRPNR
jgi:hypothetical protein